MGTTKHLISIVIYSWILLKHCIVLFIVKHCCMSAVDATFNISTRCPSILYADIVNFTPLSEKLSSHDLVATLNQLFRYKQHLYLYCSFDDWWISGLLGRARFSSWNVNWSCTMQDSYLFVCCDCFLPREFRRLCIFFFLWWNCNLKFYYYVPTEVIKNLLIYPAP